MSPRTLDARMSALPSLFRLDPTESGRSTTSRQSRLRSGCWMSLRCSACSMFRTLRDAPWPAAAQVRRMSLQGWHVASSRTKHSDEPEPQQATHRSSADPSDIKGRSDRYCRHGNRGL